MDRNKQQLSYWLLTIDMHIQNGVGLIMLAGDLIKSFPKLKQVAIEQHQNLLK